MSPSSGPKRRLATLSFFTVVSLTPIWNGTPRAFASVGPCGDIDCNARITASDALAVLKRAVNAAVTLTCPDACPANLAGEAAAAGEAAGTWIAGAADTGVSTAAGVAPTSRTARAHDSYAALEAGICGDFDCSGRVAASDALAVLRAAVNLGSRNLQCSCGGATTTLPLPTTTVPSGVCSDNIVNQLSEECDGTDDDDCRGLCQFDCTCPPPVCGNDIKELSEPCDGDDLGGATCTSLGFASGAIACTQHCERPTFRILEAGR